MSDQQIPGQIDILDVVNVEYSMGGCGDCICKTCLLNDQGKCPNGKCYDDRRAKENPYDQYHPGEIRTLWSDWQKPGEQAHWCRGGSFYKAAYCDHFIRMTGKNQRLCVGCYVTEYQDGYIQCPLVDNVGCEKCIEWNLPKDE